MHLSLILIALVATVVAKPFPQSEVQLFPPRVICTPRRGPPPAWCHQAMRRMNYDEGAHHFGEYDFVQSRGDVPVDRDAKYTLPLHFTYQSCRITVAMDTPAQDGLYHDSYSWEQLREDTLEVFRGCVEQFRYEGFKRYLGRSRRLRIEINDWHHGLGDSLPAPAIGSNSSVLALPSVLTNDTTATS